MSDASRVSGMCWVWQRYFIVHVKLYYVWSCKLATE